MKRQGEHEATAKKPISKGAKALLIIVCVLAGLAVLMAAAVFILDSIGRGALTDDGGSIDLSGANAQAFESVGTGTVRYKGKLYRYNDEISCILLMGVDEYQKSEQSYYGNANQSDVNVLAVLDPKNEKLTLISVSRDILCELEMLDSEGNFIGTGNAQLALAYSYGDGGDVSCRLTSKAASKIFYGLNIPAYASIYMNGIADLVDAVGGITVTPSESFNGFTAGQQTELKGRLTEQYIRFREHTIEGNNQRMERQKQVLMALVYKGLDSAKKDPTSVLDLYGCVKDNVTTNINAAMMVYLARQAIKLDFDGQIHNVPGHSELGEQNHAVYVVDEEAFLAMIMDIFYDPVE